MKRNRFFIRIGGIVLTLVLLVNLLSIGIFNAGAEITSSGSTGSTRVTANTSGATFSVTVPTILPIGVDSNNNVTVADNCSIVNRSNGTVKVTDVSVEGMNTWSIVNFDTDFTKVPVDTKQYGMILQGDDVATGVNADSFDVIDGDASIPVTYNANVAIQSNAITDLDIGRVVFTVAWDRVEAPAAYSISRSNIRVTSTAQKGVYYSTEDKTSSDITFNVQDDNVVTVTSDDMDHTVFSGDYNIVSTTQNSKTLNLSGDLNVRLVSSGGPNAKQYYNIQLKPEGIPEDFDPDDYVTSSVSRVLMSDTLAVSSDYSLDALDNEANGDNAYHYYLDTIPNGIVKLQALNPNVEGIPLSYFNLWIIEGIYDIVYAHFSDTAADTADPHCAYEMYIIPHSDITATAAYSIEEDYLIIGIGSIDNTYNASDYTDLESGYHWVIYGCEYVSGNSTSEEITVEADSEHSLHKVWLVDSENNVLFSTDISDGWLLDP